MVVVYQITSHCAMRDKHCAVTLVSAWICTFPRACSVDPTVSHNFEEDLSYDEAVKYLTYAKASPRDQPYIGSPIPR